MNDSAKLDDGRGGSFSRYSLVSLVGCANLEVYYGEMINGLTDDGNGSSTVCIGSGATLITTDGSGYAYSGTITGDGSFEVGPSAIEILTGTNNYWGVTTIGPGAKLQLGNGGTSGSITDSELVVDNGALVFDHSNCVTLDSPIQGSGTVTVAGGMATLLGTNTYSGGTTIDGGTTLQLGNGDSTGSIVGAVSNSGTLTFDNPGCTTFGGSISGIGAVNINDGMVTFSGGFGSNTYLGDTTIASSSKLEDGAAYSFSPNSAIYLDGTSRLGVNFNETINGLNDDGGGSSTVCIANNTTLLTNGYGYTYGGTIMGAGSIEFGAGATEILTGTNTYTGGTTIDASGTLQLGNAGSTGTISDTSAVANNGTLDFDVAGAVTFGAPISGTGSVEVMAGTLTLTGSNTYSGGTTIDSISTLQLGNGGTSGSITGNVANSGTLAFDRTDTVTFAGAISGTGSVSVSTGTVTLSGANSYSGPTTVYAGVLQAGSTSAFGSASTVTVDSTLNLNGFSNSIGSLQGGGSVNLGSATLTLLKRRHGLHRRNFRFGRRQFFIVLCDFHWRKHLFRRNDHRLRAPHRAKHLRLGGRFRAHHHRFGRNPAGWKPDDKRRHRTGKHRQQRFPGPGSRCRGNLPKCHQRHRLDHHQRRADDVLRGQHLLGRNDRQLGHPCGHRWQRILLPQQQHHPHERRPARRESQ